MAAFGRLARQLRTLRDLNKITTSRKSAHTNLARTGLFAHAAPRMRHIASCELALPVRRGEQVAVEACQKRSSYLTCSQVADKQNRSGREDLNLRPPQPH